MSRHHSEPNQLKLGDQSKVFTSIQKCPWAGVLGLVFDIDPPPKEKVTDHDYWEGISWNQAAYESELIDYD